MNPLLTEQPALALNAEVTRVTGGVFVAAHTECPQSGVLRTQSARSLHSRF